MCYTQKQNNIGFNGSWLRSRATAVLKEEKSDMRRTENTGKKLIYPAVKIKNKLCVTEKISVHTYNDYGQAVLICNQNGNKKKACWINEEFMSHGSEDSETDNYTDFVAKVPVDLGDRMIKVDRYGVKYEIRIYKVTHMACNGVLIKKELHDVKDIRNDKDNDNYKEYGVLANAVRAACLKTTDINKKLKPYAMR